MPLSSPIFPCFLLHTRYRYTVIWTTASGPWMGSHHQLQLQLDVLADSLDLFILWIKYYIKYRQCRSYKLNLWNTSWYLVGDEDMPPWPLFPAYETLSCFPFGSLFGLIISNLVSDLLHRDVVLRRLVIVSILANFLWKEHFNQRSMVIFSCFPCFPSQNS